MIGVPNHATQHFPPTGPHGGPEQAARQAWVGNCHCTQRGQGHSCDMSPLSPAQGTSVALYRCLQQLLPGKLVPEILCCGANSAILGTAVLQLQAPPLPCLCPRAGVTRAESWKRHIFHPLLLHRCLLLGSDVL